MKTPGWTTNHQRLLEALRADRVVARLVCRLSLERLPAERAPVAAWRDWARALRQDPAWAAIEPFLDAPAAWPRVWHEAVDRGFSARTDHHQALVFGWMCQQLVADQEFEVAELCWRQAVDAWLRLAQTGYLPELLDQVTGGDPPDATAAEVTRHLADDLVDARAADVRRALRLQAGLDVIDFDRRQARFGWRALGYARRRLADRDGDGALGLLATLEETVVQTCERIVRHALDRFVAMVEAVDLSQGATEAAVAPAEWVASVFGVLSIDEQAASRVTKAVVELGWKLRKTDADHDATLAAVLERTVAFKHALGERLETGEAFGHQATYADFAVFQAELADDARHRIALLEQAVALCPEHRNASMLLSYERLAAAERKLLGVRMVPTPARFVAAASRRAERTLRECRRLADEAEALYPSNEEAEALRRQVTEEAARLGASLD